jgi:hypothetical protein
MTTRREVLGAAVALGVLPPLSFARAAASVALPMTFKADRVLVDERFDEARIMAQQLRQSGMTVMTLPRDVLALWYDHLRPGLLDGSIKSVAGITDEAGVFLLRTLAADHRLRPLDRALHGLAPREAALSQPLVSWVLAVPGAGRS